MDRRFVKRPISKGVIVFAAVPGLLTGVGVTMGALRAQSLPLVLRLMLVAMGLVFVVATLAFVFSHSGLLLDRRGRTITHCIRIFGWNARSMKHAVEPADVVAVETVSTVGNSKYGKIPNSAVVLQGPSGRKFLLGTRSREEAEGVAREVTEFFGIARA